MLWMQGDNKFSQDQKSKDFSPSKWVNLAVRVRKGFAAHESKSTKQTENTIISIDLNIKKR